MKQNLNISYQCFFLTGKNLLKTKYLFKTNRVMQNCDEHSKERSTQPKHSRKPIYLVHQKYHSIKGYR